MEEDDIANELMELVLPGTEVYDDRIMPLLHSSYLYDDSRKCFQYSSAHLINSHALQTRYATFRAEKRECGYTETELEESFGFLLFDDENKATELGRTGLLVGHATCSTLGDPSRGVYISKHSDCLDFKPWYSGKTGHVAIVKITKGRVKEVTENYTLKFTPPTAGFDCHESDQMLKVTAATSSFLAFERTQYYMYEIPSGGEDSDPCPRHVLPFAIVAFSYGKLEDEDADTQEESLRVESEEKTAFDYKPWTGQLAVDSVVLDIGLKSQSGALLPAKLPEQLTAESVMRVSDLKAVLPKEVFQTCFSGEIFVGGKCCSLYEVFSNDEDDDNSSLYLLTNELQEKDLALVFLLSDSGVLIMLHSAYFLSYEGAGTEEVDALYGLFIFPDSHVIHKDSKNNQKKSALSLRISKVLPALNFAETEVEKSLSTSVLASAASPSSAATSLLSAICDLRLSLEPHLRRYGALIQPAVGSDSDDTSVPQREAAMFPDQYDCIAHLAYPLPCWTELSQLRVATYFQDPASFVIPLKRAAELVRQQPQGRDDDDDDVYYYISSPEPEETLPSSSSCGGGGEDSSVTDVPCSPENSVIGVPCSAENSVIDIPSSVDNSVDKISCSLENSVIDISCSEENSVTDAPCSADKSCTDLPCITDNIIVDKPCYTDKNGNEAARSADSSVTKMLSSEANVSKDSSIPMVQSSEENISKDRPCSQVNTSDMPHDSDKSGKDEPPLSERSDVVSDTCSANGSITKRLNSESNSSKDMLCIPLPERTSALHPDVVSDKQTTTEEDNITERSSPSASNTTTTLAVDSKSKVPSEKENLPERNASTTTTTTAAVPDGVYSTKKVPSQDPQEEGGRPELSGQHNPAEVVGSAFEKLRALFDLSGSDSAEELEGDGPTAPQEASGDAELSTGLSSDQAHRHTIEAGDDRFSEGGLDDDDEEEEVNMPSFQLDKSYGSEESDNEQQPVKSTVKVDIRISEQRPLSGTAQSPFQMDVAPQETNDASEKPGQRNVTEPSPLLKLFQRRPYLPNKGADTRKDLSHRDPEISSPKAHTTVCDAEILAHGTTPHDKKTVSALPDKEKSSDKSYGDKLTDNSVDKTPCSEENSVTNVPCSADKSRTDIPCITDNIVIVDKPCNTEKSSKDTAHSADRIITKVLSSEANDGKDSSIPKVQSSEENISKDRPCNQVNAAADMPHDSDKSGKDEPPLPERTSALHPDVVSNTSSANSSITKMLSIESNSSKDSSVTKMQSEDKSSDNSNDLKLVGRRSSQRVCQNALPDKDKSSDKSNDDKLVRRRFSERIRPHGTTPHDKKSVSALPDKEKSSDKSNDDKLVGRRFSERVRPHETTPHDKKSVSASERVRRSVVLKRPEASDKRRDVRSSTETIVLGGDHTPMKTPTSQGKKEKSVRALPGKDKSFDRSNDNRLRRSVLKRPEASDKQGANVSSSTDGLVVGNHTPVKTPTSQSEKKVKSVALPDKDKSSDKSNDDKLRRRDVNSSTDTPMNTPTSTSQGERKEDSAPAVSVAAAGAGDHAPMNTPMPTSQSEKKEESSPVVSEKEDSFSVVGVTAADAAVEVNNASENLHNTFEAKAELPSEQRPVSGLPLPPVKVGISVPDSPPRETDDKPQACLPALSPAESEKENFSPQRCSSSEDVHESSGNKNCHSQDGAPTELPPKTKQRCVMALYPSGSPTKPCSVVLCPSPMKPCSVTLNPSPSKHTVSSHPCPPQADTSHITPLHPFSAQKRPSSMTPHPQIDTVSMAHCPQRETLPVTSHPIPAQTNQSSMTPPPCPRQTETLTATPLPQKESLPVTSLQQRETLPVIPVPQKENLPVTSVQQRETLPATTRPQQDACSVTPCVSPPPPPPPPPPPSAEQLARAHTLPVVPPVKARTLSVTLSEAHNVPVVSPDQPAPTLPVTCTSPNRPIQADTLPVDRPIQADTLPVVLPPSTQKENVPLTSAQQRDTLPMTPGQQKQNVPATPHPQHETCSVTPCPSPPSAEQPTNAPTFPLVPPAQSLTTPVVTPHQSPPASPVTPPSAACNQTGKVSDEEGAGTKESQGVSDGARRQSPSLPDKLPVPSGHPCKTDKEEVVSATSPSPAKTQRPLKSDKEEKSVCSAVGLGMSVLDSAEVLPKDNRSNGAVPMLKSLARKVRDKVDGPLSKSTPPRSQTVGPVVDSSSGTLHQCPYQADTSRVTPPRPRSAQEKPFLDEESRKTDTLSATPFPQTETLPLTSHPPDQPNASSMTHLPCPRQAETLTRTNFPQKDNLPVTSAQPRKTLPVTPVQQIGTSPATDNLGVIPPCPCSAQKKHSVDEESCKTDSLPKTETLPVTSDTSHVTPTRPCSAQTNPSSIIPLLCPRQAETVLVTNFPQKENVPLTFAQQRETAQKKPSVDEKSWKKDTLPKTETLPVTPHTIPAQTNPSSVTPHPCPRQEETLPLIPQSVEGEVQLKTRRSARTEKGGPAVPLSRRVSSSLAKRDTSGESDLKSPPSAADHNYSLRSQKQSPSPPQQETPAEKDMKVRRRGQRIDYRKLAKGEEATCEEKANKKRTRHVAGLDVKMIITDCGSVFVPHGSDMQPEDVQLVRKRQKDTDRRKSLSSTSVSTGSNEAPPSTALFPDSTEYSGKVKCEAVKEDAKGQKCLSRSPDGGRPALKMAEQDQKAVDDEAEVFFTFLSSETEEPAESDMDASSSTAADASGTAGGSANSERKIRNKRKYTVTPISGLKAVFRAGRRCRSLGASLLKQWQKINSKDIFKEPGSYSDGDMSFTKELQGSDDGSIGSALLEIPLEPIPEPVTKETKKKRSGSNGNYTEARGKGKGQGMAGPTPPAMPQQHHKRELRASAFQQQRRIVQNGELIEVSRTWREAYDFGLDSKFVKNPHDATVSRALHGPWNFDQSDSEEETNLIFHIWIGLFYSQTAPRFFHTDAHQNPLQKDKPVDFLNAKPDLMPAKVAKQKDSALVALSKTGIGTSTEFLSGATQAVYHSVKGSGQHHCVGSVYAYVVDPMASLLMLASDPSDPLDLSGNKHHGDTSVSQAAVEAEAMPESPMCEVLDLSMKGKKRQREDDEEDEDRVTPGNTAAGRLGMGVGGGGGGETLRDVNMPLDMRTLVTCTKEDDDEISSAERTVADDCESPAATMANSPTANTLKHAHTTASSHSAPLKKETQGNNNPASSSDPLKEPLGNNNSASSSAPLKKDTQGNNNPASSHSSLLKKEVLGSNNPASSSSPLKESLGCSNNPASSHSTSLKKEVLGNNNPASSHSATLKKEPLGSNNPASSHSAPLKKETLGNIITVSTGPQGRTGKVVIVMESTHVSNKKEASGKTAAAAISTPSGSREEEEVAAEVKRGGSNSEDLLAKAVKSSEKELNIVAASSTLSLAGRQVVGAASAKTAGSSTLAVSGVPMAELKLGSASASIELNSAVSLSGKETVEVKCGTDKKDTVSGTTVTSSTLGLSGGLMSSGKQVVELRRGSDKEESKGSAASGNQAELSTALGLSGIPMVELKRVPVRREAASAKSELSNTMGISGKGVVDWKRVSEKQETPSGKVERTSALGLSEKEMDELKRVPVKRTAASANSERTSALGLSGKGAVDAKCGKEEAVSGKAERTSALGLSGEEMGELKSGTAKQETASGKVEVRTAQTLSGKEMVELFGRLQEDRNLGVTQDGGDIKYRFYILQTSDDAFFRETKEQLEADGHVAVGTQQLDLVTPYPSSSSSSSSSSSLPLLVVVRNQDIANHICQIPALLSLKSSPSVVFAGVDRPDDVRLRTHEELFSRGGFVLYDGAKLKELTLACMERVASLLRQLGRKGKWKWYLHYRDSRALREEARTSEVARRKKHFLDGCQEAGLVEVLPYHDCDIMSRDPPPYLPCLVRLQAQNVMRRFPVFITGQTDNSFGSSGIFTTDTFF